MPKRLPPVRCQRIFEARYAQGYRYLDRCGDLLVILEQGLGSETGLLWMPEEAAPTGARLVCPALDLKLVFDSQHMVLDQNPIPDVRCDFGNVAEFVLSQLRGRFDLRQVMRFGGRTITLAPTDDIESANKLSLRFAPPPAWKPEDSQLEARICETTCVFETPDGSSGLRVKTVPLWKLAAPYRTDERLRLAPRLLPDGQHEALTEQLRRRQQQAKDPDVGVAIDVDYYHIRPPTDLGVREFLQKADAEAQAIEHQLTGDRA